jgi:hypothetical protein
VEIDHPIAVLADSFARLPAVLLYFVEALPRIVNTIGGHRSGVHAVGTIASLYGRMRFLLNAHSRFKPRDDTGGVVELAEIASGSAQQRMYGKSQCFALNVPEGQIQGSKCIHLFASRRVKESPCHVLPEAFNVLWIPSDQAAGALVQHVLRTALANTSNARIRLDGNYHVALIEQRIRVRRRVGADPGYLHLLHSGLKFG